MLQSLNRQVLLETIVFLFGAAVMGYFTVTKKYLAYVTPRMEPFLYFMVGMLLLWAVGNITFLRKRSYTNSYYHTLILIIPVLLLFMPLPNYIPGTGSTQVGTPLMSSVTERNGIGLDVLKKAVGLSTKERTTEMSEVEAAMKPGGEQGQKADLNDTSRYGVKPVDTGLVKKSINGTAYGSTGDSSAGSKAQSGTPASGNKGASGGSGSDMDSIGGFGGTSQKDGNYTVKQEGQYATGIDNAARTVVLNDGNYYRTIMELTRATQNYVGYHITMTGYVIRDKSFYQDGDFFLGRMAMTCCIADLAPVGLAVFYKDAKSIPTDGWYTISGTIVPVDYHGMPQAGVRVTSISKASPINDYVYP